MKKSCIATTPRPCFIGAKRLGLAFLLAVLGIGPCAAKGGVGGGAFPPAPLLAPAPVPPQFDITGFIQEASLDSTGAICQAADPRLAGGTLKVNDITVIVPCNTILQMPAATLTWQELFSLAPRDIGLPLGSDGIPTQTGLALKDTVTQPLTTAYSNGPLPSYEAHVQGNVVNGRYIAGLIFISQQSLNIGQGTITAIDYDNGELLVATAGPTPSTARVKINDPIGRFGLAHGGPGSGAPLVEPGYDVRFTVDEDNATVHAMTGYPMCIPRSDPFTGDDDPLCPQANRPRAPDCRSLPSPFPAFVPPADGQFCTTFMMPPPPRSACTPAIGLVCDPDPTRQAPFEVGDFIDFLGTLKTDSRGPYLSAHTLLGHVGIYTTPGIMPAYASIEMELQGTSALPVANLPQETTSKVKVEGFTTDPTSLVDIYAIDVDPATGAVSDRLIGIADPSGPPVIGRFRFRPNAGAFLPPTREFRVVSRTLCGDPGQPCAMPQGASTYANGLIAGQYHAPNFEFIFPENLTLGDAMVPANFQDLVFLFCGSGPLTTPTAGAAPPRVRQIDPAPWAAPMSDPVFASALCPTANKVSGTAGSGGLLPPLADAYAVPATVLPGQKVNLNALTSSDPNTPPRPLTYAWTQTAGPAVALNGGGTATPNFIAPNVAAATTLSFNVAVRNNVPLVANAALSVTVNPPGGGVGVSIAAPSAVLAGDLVTLSGSIPAGAAFQWTQTAGPLVTLAGVNTLSPTFRAPAGATVLTFVLTATTAGGASANATSSIIVIPDSVTIGSAAWVNRANKGVLNVVAGSSAVVGTAPPPPGMTMTATFWNNTLADGLPGSVTNPLRAQMSLVQNLPGQLPVCLTSPQCFNAVLSGVIVAPGSALDAPVFLAPTTIVVKSSLGGSATVSGASIRIR